MEEQQTKARVPKKIKLTTVLATDHSQVELHYDPEVTEEKVSAFFGTVLNNLAILLSEGNTAITTVESLTVEVTEWTEVTILPFEPTRVRVLSGNQQEDYGEGLHIGYVDVFCYQMPDGSLISFHDAEKPLDPDKAPLVGHLVRLGHNPKIKLDTPRPDGSEYVYGCQVYWAVIDEEDDAEVVPTTEQVQ